MQKVGTGSRSLKRPAQQYFNLTFGVSDNVYLEIVINIGKYMSNILFNSVYNVPIKEIKIRICFLNPRENGSKTNKFCNPRNLLPVPPDEKFSYLLDWGLTSL